ncbi:MAG: glycosyltransferase family 2 protein [Bacteroidota bacterium]
MSTGPLFSIIIATRNRPGMLVEALRSIQYQEVSDWEVLLIDDASEERQADLLPSSLSKDERIRISRNDQHIGVASSRNRGLEQAKGKWVLFLDDDDAWQQGLLQTVQAQTLKTGPNEALALHCQMHPKSVKNSWRYHSLKTALRESSKIPERNRANLHLLVRSPPQMPALVCRRQSIGEIRFDEGRQYGEDVLFWAQVVEKGLTVKTIPARQSSVLVRHHNRGHLSHHDALISGYLDRFAETFPTLDERVLAAIQVKKVTQSIARRAWKEAIIRIRNGMKKPGGFPGLFLYQTKLKLKTLGSFCLFRLLKIDW